MNIAMILAGGVGARVGAGIPKQFIEVQGKPILVHTLELFQDNPDVDIIEVVAIESHFDYVKELAERFGLTKVKVFAPGGATYQDSVISGLNALEGICEPDDLVLIHFGVSPFVTSDIVSDSIRVAREHGNGVSADPVVLCLAVKDSEDSDSSAVTGSDRERVLGLNSPQTFRYALLRRLYDEGQERGVLDTIDPHTTSLMFELGERLFFSRGSSMNIKITTRDDIQLFEAFLNVKNACKEANE